jgi:hypothetical protein
MRSTKPNTTRKIVHDVTPDDWKQAREKWLALMNRINPPTPSRLLDFQQAFWGKLEEDPKSVIGEPVLIIAQPTGGWYTGHTYPATILKVTEDGGQWIITCLYQPIEEERWENERIEKVYIHQLLPLVTNEPLSPEEKTKLETYLSFMALLNPINRMRNSALTRLQQEKASIQSSLQSLRRDMARYENNLAKISESIETTTDDSLSVDDLRKTLDQVGAHHRVAWAMYDQRGNLIVETQMLNVIDPATNKENKRKPIGRFAFRISTSDGFTLQATNLDYEGTNGHKHPNINGTSVCLGGNQNMVMEMMRKGDFYGMIDFLILFFSMFPHDPGSGPYCDPIRWLQDKTKVPHNNPWRTESTPILYIVSQTTEDAKKRVYKKKRKKPVRKPKEEVGETSTPVTPPTLTEAVVEPNPICPTCDCSCTNCECQDMDGCQNCGCDHYREASCSECDCACEDCDCTSGTCSDCGCNHYIPF